MLLYRLVTLAELAKMLGGRGDQSKLDPNRQPICLLLGGGMAAGKSTVRKIIGQAEFWTRVSFICDQHSVRVHAQLSCMVCANIVQKAGTSRSCNPAVMLTTCNRQEQSHILSSSFVKCLFATAFCHRPSSSFAQPCWRADSLAPHWRRQA